MYILMRSYTYIVTIHNIHIPYISNQTKKYLSSINSWSRVRVHMYISLTYSTHGRESNILTMHILQLRRWTSNMCMKIMMINSYLKDWCIMHFQQKEAIFALVWKGRAHPWVSGVVFVSCSTDAEGPGHLPAVLTIHYFITMQQFVYCQQPVLNNNLQWTTTVFTHLEYFLPIHLLSLAVGISL